MGNMWGSVFTCFMPTSNVGSVHDATTDVNDFEDFSLVSFTCVGEP